MEVGEALVYDGKAEIKQRNQTACADNRLKGGTVGAKNVEIKDGGLDKGLLGVVYPGK